MRVLVVTWQDIIKVSSYEGLDFFWDHLLHRTSNLCGDHFFHSVLTRADAVGLCLLAQASSGFWSAPFWVTSRHLYRRQRCCLGVCSMWSELSCRHRHRWVLLHCPMSIWDRQGTASRLY